MNRTRVKSHRHPEIACTLGQLHFDLPYSVSCIDDAYDILFFTYLAHRFPGHDTAWEGDDGIHNDDYPW